MRTNKKIIDELKRLSSENDDILTPQIVINSARSKDSILHDQFEWDDTAAAKKYRIVQARELLQVTVEYVRDSKGNKKQIRVFASLKSDRIDGGYRTMVDIFSDKEYRKQLLQDALDDLETFKRKYFELKEFAIIFDAINKIKNKAA